MYVIHPNPRNWNVLIIIKRQFFLICQKCWGASVNLEEDQISVMWRKYECGARGLSVLSGIVLQFWIIYKYWSQNSLSEPQFVNYAHLRNKPFEAFLSLGLELNMSHFFSHEYLYWFWTLSKRKLSWGHKVSSVAATVQVIKVPSLTLSIPIQPCEV